MIDFRHQSEHSTDNSDSSSSSGYLSRTHNILKLKDSFLNRLIVMIDKSPQKSWTNFLLNLLVLLYSCYGAVSLSVMGDYNWGEYGLWISKALNYPITFSLELIPYEAMIVLCVICMIFILSALVLLVITARASMTASRNMKNYRILIKIVAYICFFGHLTIPYLMTSFMDCDRVSETKSFEGYSTDQYVLVRFPTKMCYSPSNIALVATCVAVAVLFIPVTALYNLIVANTHLKSKSVFIAESPFFFTHFMAISQLQTIVMYAIPNNLLYVRSIIHIVLSATLVPSIFHFLPHYSMSENGFMSGIVFAKISSSAGSLISSFINTKQDFGLGLGTMGMSLALAMVGFIIGFVTMIVYLGFSYYSIRRGFIACLHTALANLLQNSGGAAGEYTASEEQVTQLRLLFEKEGYSYFKELEEEKKIKSLTIFIKLAARKTAMNNDALGLSDNEMCISLIKSVAQHRSFSYPENIIASALFTAYFWKEGTNCFEYSLSLLKKVKKYRLNILTEYIWREKVKELEILLLKKSGEGGSGGISFVDVKHILANLERQHHTILSWHKALWKEFSNEMVNFGAVIAVNRKITQLTVESGITFENLMKDFGGDKTVLRMYARFLETVIFEYDRAQELYQEATEIEEEKEGKVYNCSFSKSPMSNSTYNPKTPFSPLSPGGFNTPPSTKPIYFGKLTESFESAKEMTEEAPELLNLINEACEDPELRKESLFRMSLSTSSNSNVTYIVVLTFTIVSFVAFAACFGFGYYALVASTKDMTVIIDNCIPSVDISYLLMENRIEQMFKALSIMDDSHNSKLHLQTSLISKGIHNYTSFNEIHKERLTKVISGLKVMEEMALGGGFTSEIYHDYASESHPFNIPHILSNNHSTEEGEFYGSESLNSSISFNTNLLIQMARQFKEYSIEQFNSTLTNFKFMFLWTNRDAILQNYQQYCLHIVDRNYDAVYGTELIFRYFYISCLLAVLMVFTFSMVVFVMVVSSLKNAMKLVGRNIPKDSIIKLYQLLSTRSQQESAVDQSGTSLSDHLNSPSVAFTFLSILLLVLSCLCMSMFYMEVNGVSLESELIMKSIAKSVKISNYAQKGVLSIGELFAFNLLPNSTTINNPKLITKDELTALHNGIDDIKLQINTLWNKLIYGDRENDEKHLIGMFTKVDEIIVGSSATTTAGNCSSTTATKHNNNGTDSSPSSQHRCWDSLNDMINLFSVELSIVNQMFETASTQTTVDPLAVFSEFYVGIYSICSVLTDGIEEFLNIYIEAIQNDTSSLVSIIFAVFGLLTIPFTGYLLFSSLDDHYNEFQTFRMMLNYVKIEYLDAKDEIRDFVLYNQINKGKKSKTSQQQKEEEKDKVKCIFNNAVDGVIYCNSDFDVEIYNPAARLLFMRNVNDVVGLSVFNLFDASSHEKLANVFEAMTSEAASTTIRGETIELDCVKKNGSLFPAKVNISWAMIDSKIYFLFVIKDITLERKQALLLAEEKKTSENLLRNILPTKIAQRLMNGETFIAEKLPDVTCLFTDMIGFTEISSILNPQDVVLLLGSIVNGFDKLTEKYNIEKIKTIGDSYFCCGGLDGGENHPETVLQFAMETFSIVRDINSNRYKESLQLLCRDDPKLIQTQQLNVRIGLNTGSVVAGVIGFKKFAYDLWGDTINVASRMESNSESGRIQVARSTYERVKHLQMEFEERKLQVKGKGSMFGYLLNERYHLEACLTNEDQMELVDCMRMDLGLENGGGGTSRIDEDDDVLKL